MGISEGEQEAKQKAFSRARNDLLDMNLVGVWKGFYWKGASIAGHRTTSGHCPDLSSTEPDKTGHTPLGVSGVRVRTEGVDTDEPHATGPPE